MSKLRCFLNRNYQRNVESEKVQLDIWLCCLWAFCKGIQMHKEEISTLYKCIHGRLPNSVLLWAHEWNVSPSFKVFQAKRMTSSTNFIPLVQGLPQKRQPAKHQNRMICIPLSARFQLCILNYFQIKSLFKYLLTVVFIQLQINCIFRTKRSFQFWPSFHSCLNAVEPSPAMERNHALHRQLPSAAPSTFWSQLDAKG